MQKDTNYKQVRIVREMPVEPRVRLELPAAACSKLLSLLRQVSGSPELEDLHWALASAGFESNAAALGSVRFTGDIIEPVSGKPGHYTVR